MRRVLLLLVGLGVFLIGVLPASAARADSDDDRIDKYTVTADLAKDGTDRAGNPDFLTLDEPSPAGAFAYNTILVDFKKTDLNHRPGWDTQAPSRSVIFRRDK